MSNELISSREPVSRGKVKCFCCNSTIQRGQKYLRQTCVFDGRLYDWTTCQPCIEITPDVLAWCSYVDDGVDGEDYYGWAGDHPDNPKAKAYLERVNQ